MSAESAVTHGFWNDATAPLFVSHHAPSAPARNVAWIMCQPLHVELIQSYRSMRRCAETLAAAGFHVLRLHYDGTGESIASSDDDSDRVPAWLASVRHAITAARAIAGVDAVGLLGVRMGAGLALSTATEVDVEQLVLWEPIAGNMYAREMEILGTPGLDATMGVMAGGFRLAPDTLAALRALPALEKMVPRGKPDVLLVHRDDRKAPPRLREHLQQLGCDATAVQLPGHKEMMIMPQKSLVPEAVLAGIRDWALARSHSSSQPAREPDEGKPNRGAGVDAATVHDGLRWRTLRFGANEHLLGVLTEPEHGAAPGLPAVLLLTGGVTPRTAGNGSYVALARRLAKRGHAVLRMDVSGIGESDVLAGMKHDPLDPFPTSIVDDARAGLARLAGERTPVWVVGLCSGAYAAFQSMLLDPRVVGAIIINPVLFHMSAASTERAEPGPATQGSTVRQLQQMDRYWKVMRDPASWKKLLSGKADVRHIASVVGSRAASRLSAMRERVAPLLGLAPRGLAGRWACANKH